MRHMSSGKADSGSFGVKRDNPCPPPGEGSPVERRCVSNFDNSSASRHRQHFCCVCHTIGRGWLALSLRATFSHSVVIVVPSANDGMARSLASAVIWKFANASKIKKVICRGGRLCSKMLLASFGN